MVFTTIWWNVFNSFRSAGFPEKLDLHKEYKKDIYWLIILFVKLLKTISKHSLIILAGGFGTRISEYTKTIPKPMIKINQKPIIIHIMEHYAKYGFDSFYIALGYKGSVIKNYFKNKKFKWEVNLVDTGLKTMTGGRLKRLKKLLGNDTFRYWN